MKLRKVTSGKIEDICLKGGQVQKVPNFSFILVTFIFLLSCFTFLNLTMEFPMGRAAWDKSGVLKHMVPLLIPT